MRKDEKRVREVFELGEKSDLDGKFAGPKNLSVIKMDECQI